MKSVFSQLSSFFSHSLWDIETTGLKRAKRLWLIALRLVYKLQDEFRNGELTVRASSLVYTTLLTFVPLLAIAFAVLKGLGVHNMLAPTIYSFLEPIGDKGEEIGDTILEYVDRVNVKVLGTVGLAFLLYTVITTVQQVESAFNHFWQITKTRDFLRKFRDYLSVLMVGPILLVSAIGLTTTVMSTSILQWLSAIEPFGTAIVFLTKLVPYLLTILAFTMFYFLLPNTKVRFVSALAGGATAGILWQLLSWAFAKFLVSTAKYSAVYSGFAIILVFMIWLYFNWLIMLIGVKVAFYHQFPAMLRLRSDNDVFSERFKYRLALAIMYYIGLHYREDKPRWTLNALVMELKLPVAPVLEVLDALERQKLILAMPKDATFLPARDVSSISVREVLMAVEHEMHGDSLFGQQICSIPEIERLIRKMDGCISDALGNDTVKTLLSAPDAQVCELGEKAKKGS
ncbi:MAG TPA: YihY/virulence factor BrkB family protein [Dissulfurispiraceae bacterium]|nr:YihY/virulence factor BrkB family protein [Dissulfurispiraceae bacterium]